MCICTNHPTCSCFGAIWVWSWHWNVFCYRSVHSRCEKTVAWSRCILGVNKEDSQRTVTALFPFQIGPGQAYNLTHVVSYRSVTTPNRVVLSLFTLKKEKYFFGNFYCETKQTILVLSYLLWKKSNTCHVKYEIFGLTDWKLTSLNFQNWTSNTLKAAAEKTIFV